MTESTRLILTPRDNARLPKTYIKINRKRFRLYVYERMDESSPLFKPRPVFRCWIALGAVGFETPTGPHMVHMKESPPTYTAPDSDWAREAGYKEGEKLPFDHPMNPLRGAFLWLTHTGVGIHGTPNLLSLRSKASHGCIRVSEKSALWLYRRIDLGTVVDIT